MVWVIDTCAGISKCMEKFRRSVQTHQKLIRYYSMECACQNRPLLVVMISQMIDQNTRIIIFIIIPFKYCWTWVSLVGTMAIACVFLLMIIDYKCSILELGALYINSKLATRMWLILAEMGHPQPLTPIQPNNLTAYGIVTNKIILKATKAMGMQFHWLHDCEQQNPFQFHWQSEKMNYANYWTKHHLAAHNKIMHTVFLTKLENIANKVKQAWVAASGNRKSKIAISSIKTGVSTSKAAARVCWNL